MLREIVRGNQSIFFRHDEIETAWKKVEELGGQVHPYIRGSQGPEALEAWSQKHNVRWRA